MGCASCHQGPSVSARLSSSHVSSSLVDYLSALAEAHALYQRVLPLMQASHFLATRPACRGLRVVRGDRYGRTPPEGVYEKDRELAPTGPLAVPPFPLSAATG